MRQTTLNKRDEITSAQTTSAQTLPLRRPAESASHGILNCRQVIQHKLVGSIIEIDEGICQVAIIGQNEIASGSADKLRDLGALTVDIQLGVSRANDVTILEGIDADTDAVIAMLALTRLRTTLLDGN